MKNNRMLAAVAALVLLAGCGAPTDKPADITPPAVSVTQQPPTAPQETVLGQLAQIPGKSDEAVTALLGDGDASYAEDKTLVGRDYTRDVFGENATVSVGYADGITADQVSVLFASTTFSAAQTELTALYGAPTATAKNDNTGGQSATWNVDNIELTLLEAYGAVSLSLLVPAA